jgi:hypothetical protein
MSDFVSTAISIRLLSNFFIGVCLSRMTMECVKYSLIYLYHNKS